MTKVPYVNNTSSSSLRVGYAGELYQIPSGRTKVGEIPEVPLNMQHLVAAKAASDYGWVKDEFGNAKQVIYLDYDKVEDEVPA